MHVKMKKIVSTFTSVVVIMTTKKIAGPPDPLSWWSCGPLLIKICVKPWNVSSLLGAPVLIYINYRYLNFNIYKMHNLSTFNIACLFVLFEVYQFGMTRRYEN